MSEACFSAWIGRANPAPNIGICEARDAQALARDLCHTFRIGQDSLPTCSDATLADWHAALWQMTPSRTPQAVWIELTTIAEKYAALPAQSMAVHMTLFDRIYD